MLFTPRTLTTLAVLAALTGLTACDSSPNWSWSYRVDFSARFVQDDGVTPDTKVNLDYLTIDFDMADGYTIPLVIDYKTASSYGFSGLSTGVNDSLSFKTPKLSLVRTAEEYVCHDICSDKGYDSYGNKVCIEYTSVCGNELVDHVYNLDMIRNSYSSVSYRTSTGASVTLMGTPDPMYTGIAYNGSFSEVDAMPGDDFDSVAAPSHGWVFVKNQAQTKYSKGWNNHDVFTTITHNGVKADSANGGIRTAKQKVYFISQADEDKFGLAAATQVKAAAGWDVRYLENETAEVQAAMAAKKADYIKAITSAKLDK